MFLTGGVLCDECCNPQNPNDESIYTRTGGVVCHECRAKRRGRAETEKIPIHLNSEGEPLCPKCHKPLHIRVTKQFDTIPWYDEMSDWQFDEDEGDNTATDFDGMFCGSCGDFDVDNLDEIEIVTQEVEEKEAA